MDLDEEWPGEVEQRLFQRLVLFFAEPAERQAALISDFAEERYFDTAEGHVKTVYPVEILLIGLKDWAGRFYNYGAIAKPYREQLGRLLDIVGKIEEEGSRPENWMSAYWSIGGLTGRDTSGIPTTPSSQLWSELRSTCMRLNDAMPVAGPVFPGEMESLLHNI